MKKTVLAMLVILMLVASVPVMADEATLGAPVQSADNIVSANVLSYLLLFFNVAYERKIFDAMSIRVRASDWALISAVSSGAAGWYGVGADIYFYPAAKACKGFFLGPRIDLIWVGAKTTDSSTGESVTGTYDNIRVGAQIGYKWVFDGGFEMALALGGWSGISSHWTVSSGSASVSQPSDPLNTFLPTVDYDIGYAF